MDLQLGLLSNSRSDFTLRIKDLSWCPRPESNRHALRRGILSPLRLPISPPGPWGIAREALWNEDVHYTVYKNFAREAVLRYPQSLYTGLPKSRIAPSFR